MIKTTLALGTFDGLHKGHMAVLDSAFGECKTALVFRLPPSMEISGEYELLMTPKEKINRLSGMGFTTETLEFSAVKNTTAEDFLADILKKYNPRKICCGYDYRFGADAKGDCALLAQFCQKNGIEFCCVNKITDGGKKISSSLIRKLLKDGKTKKANALLSAPFSVFGTVLGGDKRGTNLGFPTANFYYPDGLVEVKSGVYATHCTVDGKVYNAATYIGKRPTYMLNKTICETNILDFSGDIYGKEIKLELMSFLREDKKFSSAEKLARQIKKDIKKIKRTCR